MIKLDFEKGNGLLPVVVQDVHTKEVLMLAYMNEESLNKTIETKVATYYSRSRQALWVKGETSGHYQYVKDIRIDVMKIPFYYWWNKLVQPAIQDTTVVFIAI